MITLQPNGSIFYGHKPGKSGPTLISVILAVKPRFMYLYPGVTRGIIG